MLQSRQAPEERVLPPAKLHQVEPCRGCSGWGLLITQSSAKLRKGSWRWPPSPDLSPAVAVLRLLDVQAMVPSMLVRILMLEGGWSRGTCSRDVVTCGAAR